MVSNYFGWLAKWLFLGEGKGLDFVSIRSVGGQKWDTVVLGRGDWGFGSVVAGTCPIGI